MLCNSHNDGTRSLFESILVPEVEAAFKDWNKSATDAKCVLIGGIALSFYVKPRMTTDADQLFMSAADIPATVDGFKRTRPGAFMHKHTHVEIEVLTPSAINMSVELAHAIFDRAQIHDGIRVAEPSGIVAAKLGRFKLRDQADIEELLAHFKIDLDPYPLSAAELARYDQLRTQLSNT
jgi:hypothetical protein